MIKRIAIWIVAMGCAIAAAVSTSSCSSRGRSTAHIQKHSGFKPGKGKAKSPAKRIKSTRK